MHARRFVNWYNGHPTAASSVAMRPPLSAVESAVVIGNGNVALDCARVLCKSVDELRATDIAADAVTELERRCVCVRARACVRTLTRGVAVRFAPCRWWVAAATCRARSR